MSRKPKPQINRTDALNHHQGWGETTRAQVRDEIDRLGGVEFRKNVHGFWNSIQVFDGSGEFVADLMKTQVRYPPQFAPPGAEDRGSKDGLLILSLDGVERAGGSARTASRPEVEPTFCPNHPWLALPATGICEDCGWTTAETKPEKKPFNYDKFTTSEKPLTFKTIEEAVAYGKAQDEKMGLKPPKPRGPRVAEARAEDDDA